MCGEKHSPPQDFSFTGELIEQVAEQALEILPELLRLVINTACHPYKRIYNCG